MKQAMIFAAGLGTRLKPLTDTMPKALVRVGGEPLLKRVVLKLKEAGFNHLVVNVHHFSQQIIDYLKANDNFGLDIRVSDETQMLLDTGGGLRKALSLFDVHSPILIHNVDILSNVNLDDLWSQARLSAATLLVSNRQTKRYLLFEKTEGRRLYGWTNIETGEVKSPYESLNVTCYDRFAFSGIHVVSPELYPLLLQMPEKFGIVDFYLQHCKDHLIRGKVAEDLKLLDVGKLSTLQEAETFIQNINTK